MSAKTKSLVSNCMFGLMQWLPMLVELICEQALCGAAHCPCFTRWFVRCVNCCAGASVRNDNDADVIYYLNMARLPVIGNESLRTQLLELSRLRHRPKQSRDGSCGAARRMQATKPVCESQLGCREKQSALTSIVKCGSSCLGQNNCSTHSRAPPVLRIGIGTEPQQSGQNQ